MRRRLFLQHLIALCPWLLGAGRLGAAALTTTRDPEGGRRPSTTDFDRPFPGDLYLTPERQVLVDELWGRLRRLQRFVGHGRFNLIGFDDALYMARNYSQIGAFTRTELDYCDELFATDPRIYGFLGAKVIDQMTHRIASRDVKKVPGSGHYLLRSGPLAMYEQLRRDVGPTLYLTSGVRNVVKQIYLFLNKTRNANGNLSQASRSLAPPGYSFHALGDFDVGKVGLGELNFTESFSGTSEYRRLAELGYVLRYPDQNPFGVRFEPWHIEGFKRT